MVPDADGTEWLHRHDPGIGDHRHDDPGNVTYLSDRKCPIRHATAYLTLPEPGTVCPAEEP
jgi:hypothetical protein